MLNEKNSSFTGKKKSYLPVMIFGILLTFLLSTFTLAQPLSKRFRNLTLKERTNQTLIPFEYSNYNKVGPLSRNVLIRIRQNDGDIKYSFSANDNSFFLKQKRHSASFRSINKPGLIKDRKTTISLFAERKRHKV